MPSRSPLARSIITVPLLCLSTAYASPPIFADLTHDQAIVQSLRNESDLVIKFTADWCLPCKEMDKTTWSDESTVQWLNESGYTVIAIDIDEHTEIANLYNITSIPAMVVINSGQIIDRAVGYQSPDQLTDWLTGVREGSTLLSKARAESRNDTNSGEGLVDARREYAEQLVNNAQYAQAADEYIWLWNNMTTHKPSSRGVRVSFMASDMAKLAASSLEAQRKLTELRDTATARLEKSHTSDRLSDWLVLNLRVLKDHQTVQQWIDRNTSNKNFGQSLSDVGHVIDDYLIETGQWELLGHALRSADQIIKKVERRLNDTHLSRFDQDTQDRLRALNKRSFISDLANAHAGFLAADREEEAWQLTDKLFETYNTKDEHTLLLQTVFDAEQVRPEHLELAKKADRKLVRKCKVVLAKQRLEDD